MADIGTEFLTFLKVYYPEDYGKAASDNVSDAVLTAISTKHKEKFDIWLKVPERIRDEYLGRVPNDILEAAKTDNNLTLAECRKIEAERSNPDLAEKADIIVPPSLDGFDSLVLKNMKFNEEEQQKIITNAKRIMESGYSKVAAVRLGSVSITQNKLLRMRQNREISKTTFKESWLELRKDQRSTMIKDWIDNQPEKMYLNVAKRFNSGEIDKQAATEQMEALMKRIKAMGREQELEEYIEQPKSGYKKLKPEALELFGSIRENTTADASVDVYKLYKMAGIVEEKSAPQADSEDIRSQLINLSRKQTMTEEEFNSGMQAFRHSQQKAIKQSWIDNQPEKMIAHIAKELNRGKIDKDTALPQMDTLMKKVKAMGREQELAAYLKQPQSGYTRLNEDNKILFNELMLSHDVGNVAQSINKIRAIKPKTTENAEQIAPKTQPTPNVAQQPTNVTAIKLQIQQTERA